MARKFTIFVAVFTLLVATIIGGVVFASTYATKAAATPITLPSLIGEMTSLDHLTRSPDTAYTTKQASSYDRSSTTPADMHTWFANGDFGNFIRTEVNQGRTEFVMMDANGPGAVVRIWTANPSGTLRIYIDGSNQPALEAPMADLLSGGVAPFVSPLGQKISERNGLAGYTLYFPFPYQTHCKVTVDQNTGNGTYYHVDYRTYTPGTTMQSYSPTVLNAAQPDIDHAVAVLSGQTPVYQPGPQSKTQTFQLSVAGTSVQNTTIQAPATSGGIIRKLVLQSSTTDANVLRNMTLVMRFDGQETNKAPLGDFFGSGPGVNVYQSLPLSVAADGTFTSYWAMPFQQNAVIELHGPGAGQVQINGTTIEEPYTWDSQSLYFHAKWHSQTMNTNPPRDWNYVTIQGRGVYVGNMLDIYNPVPVWWGEGDEKIYVDGEKFPGWFGTGTEDYYSYAWSSPVPFTSAYHNQTHVEGDQTQGNTSVNRWHIIDAIPFTQNFRFDMEILHQIPAFRPGNEVVTYGTVNYWYGDPTSTDNVSTFNTNLPSATSINSTWTNVIGGNQGTSPNGDGFYLSNQSASDFNYEGDLSVQTSNPSAASLVFRSADNPLSGSYLVNINTENGGQVKFFKFPYASIATINTPITPNVSYHIKVSAVGNHFQVYLNGAPVINTNDSTYSSGKFGLNVWNGSGLFQNVYYSSIFDSNLTGWHAVSGTWEDGIGGVHGSSFGDSFYLSDQVSPANFTYEGDLTLQADNAAALIFRSADNPLSGAYAVNISTENGGQVKFFKFAGPAISIVPESIQLNVTYHLKIVATGSHFQIYLNNALIITADDSTYTGGKFGLNAWFTHAVYQHVKLS